MGELTTGSFSLAFEEDFLDEVARTSARDPLAPRWILVGSNFLGLHLRRRLAEKTGGHTHIHFLTFVDLALRIMGPRLLDEGRIPFPSDVEEFLLADLAARLPDGSLFGEVREQEGFHRALRTTFHDLIDGGITSLAGFDGKVGEIGKLFTLHRTHYLPRFATTGDLILEAAAAAESAPLPLGARELFCYGFYDLTEAQRRLLRSLSKVLNLRIWVPSPGSDFFTTLGLKARQLPSSESIEPELFGASWNYTEAEEVVRRLLEQAEKGVELPNMGILLRQPENYAPMFADVLNRAGLPFYREGGTPLPETQMGRALNALLDLLGTETQRSEVIHALALYPFREELLQNQASPADWDAWTRAARVTRGKGNFINRLRTWSKKQQEPRQIPAFLELVSGWFDALERLERSADSWSSFARGFESFLSSYTFRDSPGLTESIEAVRELHQLQEVGLSADLPRVRSALKRRLQKTGVRGNAFGKGALFLGSLSGSRAIPFDVIALPGLLERVFPAPPRPDPLLLDGERREINRRLHGGVALKETRRNEDRDLFHLACRQARRRLIVSFPRFNVTDGKELLPSTFVTDLIDSGKCKMERLPFVRWGKPSHRFQIDRFDWLSSRLAATALGEGFGGLADFHPLAPAVQKWVEERLSRPYWTEFDGKVQLPVTAGEPTFSPSDIEKYAQCPYRYFLSKVLGLVVQESPDEAERIRPTDRGTLIHAILFRLFSELKKENLLPLAPAHRSVVYDRLEHAAQAEFARAEGELPLGHRLIWETEKAFIQADLRALLEYELREDSLFVPADFETRFGMPKRREDGELSTESPIVVEAGRRKIRLKGMIDRMDLSVDRKRARIIDYKTGAASNFKDDAFHGGTSMQSAIYLSALPLFFPDIDLPSSEAVLLSTLFTTGFRRARFSGLALEARRDDFHNILSTVAEGAAAGFFPPRPGENLSNCRNCDFVAICGKGVLRVYERKREDPSGAAVMALEDIE